MAVTTFAAIRAEQVALIEALAPTSVADAKYRIHQSEDDFRTWVSESARASFRRFDIVDLFEDDATDISDHSSEYIHSLQEIVIAYPDGYRYGSDGQRSRGDVVRQDMHQILTSVGPRGHANLTNAATTDPESDLEEIDGAQLLVIRQRVHYHRSF